MKNAGKSRGYVTPKQFEFCQPVKGKEEPLAASWRIRSPCFCDELALLDDRQCISTIDPLTTVVHWLSPDFFEPIELNLQSAER